MKTLQGIKRLPNLIFILFDNDGGRDHEPNRRNNHPAPIYDKEEDRHNGDGEENTQYPKSESQKRARGSPSRPFPENGTGKTTPFQTETSIPKVGKQGLCCTWRRMKDREGGGCTCFSTWGRIPRLGIL